MKNFIQFSRYIIFGSACYWKIASGYFQDTEIYNLINCDSFQNNILYFRKEISMRSQEHFINIAVVFYLSIYKPFLTFEEDFKISVLEKN